ncbi:MAG TPA: four helix bundle protein [Terriglobales bacterium]|jgi:four helix bundle protein|nr:four helix bundle protein [Terriglobales bacterium]
MKDFKELKVWVKAHELTLSIYKSTRSFPREEVYGLTSQLRRAAASIGANIAEGCGRRSDGEFHRFLQIARGSASELEYHLLLARDLHLMSESDFRAMEVKVAEVQRMLTSLAQSLTAAPSLRRKLVPIRAPIQDASD